MEIVMGIGEEGRPKACSSETGSAKQQDVDSGEKTLEEKGARISENGEQKVLGHVDDNKSKENVVVVVAEKENLNDSGVIEDCVMNGVSSLLKLKQDVSGKEKEIDDEDEDEDEDSEEDEEEEHGYHVGDFVWGKIKNHPWWPGQIYDPSEASDLALKIKQKGKLLVAYFGDRTFAWCGASQLKPFAESFKECSNVSNSRGIVSAVEEAVEEMGRHMERLLIRDCAEEKKHELECPQVKNAGIKEGVVVPDVRREMISSLLVGKPEGILQDVKGFAETVSFSGLLELEIVKRKVSAFYRSKRGYGLIEYPEPQSVPGLEDKNNDDDGGATIEKGKKEEEASSSIQKPLETCSGFPDHRLQHRRKQKSIADILENESSAMVRFETDSNGKESRRKKVKRRDEAALTTTTPTPRRRRMKEVVTIEENSKGKTFSRKRKKRDDDDDDSTPLASTQTTKRERKKSKYFSPEYLSDFSSKRKKSKTEPESSKVSSPNQIGEQMTNASNSLVAVEEDMLDKPCELLLLENGIGQQEVAEELSNAVDFLRLGATSVEIRDLIRVSALGTQYPKDSSSRDMVREFMSMYRSFTYDDGANSKFLGSYNGADTDKEEVNEPESKGKERKYKKRKTKEQTEEIGKEERKPKTPKSKKQADEETRKESTKNERKLKKNKRNEEEETLKEASGSTKKERKAKKSKFEEEERQNEAEKKKKRQGKSKKQEVEVEETKKEFSGAELFVTFGPGSSLPKKEALIEIYGKFGALDEEKTNVFDTNFCASIAFLNVADGEKAFESSVEKSPFASTSTVKFRLKYPNEKKAEAEVAETTMEMEHLKKKLEEMISLVDESEGRMTEEVKVKLENEMVNLLEKVRKMRSF